jgi:hypothetical protein
MRLSPSPLITIARVALALSASLALVSAARAQVYDFSRLLSGGAGGTDPQKRQIVANMGSYMCLAVGPGVEPNSVRFMVYSRMPQPNARTSAVVFDVGAHKNLFRQLTIGPASPGVTAKLVQASEHPFLRGLSPTYWIDLPQRGHLRPEGLGPGKMIMITAALHDGRTITDVYNALHEGLNQTSGGKGLRVGVIVMYMLGGPPPGVGTIHDDAGFMLTRPSQACR